jgi:hypothetical protein
VKTQWPLVAATAIALACVSCVLLVDNSTPYGLTCHFASETTAGSCGECIAKSCQSEVTACCGDPICTGNLGSLDTCAANGTCASLFADANDAGGDAGIRASLNECVTTACSTDCTNTSGDASAADTSTTSAGGVNCSATNKLECTCDLTSSKANGNACSPESLGQPNNTVCCGTVDWATLGTCSCYVYECILDNDGLGSCDCGLTSGDDPDTQFSPGAGCNAPEVNDPNSESSGCCLSSDGMHCYCSIDTDGEDFECQPGETSTSSCEAKQFACPNGESNLPSCN